MAHLFELEELFLSYKDQTFKVGNSVSNSKFHLIYQFSSENGKLLALHTGVVTKFFATMSTISAN